MTGKQANTGRPISRGEPLVLASTDYMTTPNFNAHLYAAQRAK